MLKELGFNSLKVQRFQAVGFKCDVSPLQPDLILSASTDLDRTRPPVCPTHMQNLALNIAEKGFPISVFNRSASKTDDCVARAKKEGA